MSTEKLREALAEARNAFARIVREGEQVAVDKLFIHRAARNMIPKIDAALAAEPEGVRVKALVWEGKNAATFRGCSYRTLIVHTRGGPHTFSAIMSMIHAGDVWRADGFATVEEARAACEAHHAAAVLALLETQ